jgi:hypothetical protein
VPRRVRRLAVVSWIGGAASILPFATGWFGLSTRAANALLLAALVSTFAFNLLIGAWPALQEALSRLAGPPTQPSHALVLVAVVAGAGIGAMVAAAALAGSP